MSIIRDSTAVLDEDRQFAQHQAALTLLQGLISNPEITNLKWLDLACGKGQIIVHLKTNLPPEHRGKINYHCVDVQESFVTSTVRRAEDLGLATVNSYVSELSRIAAVLPGNEKFDFITLTNTIHEIDPENLAALLFECIYRLSDKGCLFIYDMEKLPVRELGAIVWKAYEIRQIFDTLLAVIGIQSSYRPAPGTWRHTSCNGWNMQVIRSHFGALNSEISDVKHAAISETSKKIAELIQAKKNECFGALNSLTRFPQETPSEKDDELDLLYHFWAIHRSMEKTK